MAEFAEELFGESFSLSGVIFGSSQARELRSPRRYHAFLRALEGAFLVHQEGRDEVVLNRKGEFAAGIESVPLEIALCRECGQHYYVGRERRDRLQEAVRDPSQPGFGVEYYRPLESSAGASHVLCRRCGRLSVTANASLACKCDDSAVVYVAKCASHKDQADQLKECATCGYQRGGVGDPVQEIVHGSDGPNAVIATALHELLPEEGRKLLAFADSRQEAAFFAWYAEDSYRKLRDRNLMLRALQAIPIAPDGLSIDDLRSRLLNQWDQAMLFSAADTAEGRYRKVLESLLREALTDERRLSLSGVGLVEWSVKIPDDVALPASAGMSPWNLSEQGHSPTAWLSPRRASSARCAGTACRGRYAGLERRLVLAAAIIRSRGSPQTQERQAVGFWGVCLPLPISCTGCWRTAGCRMAESSPCPSG